MKEIAIYVEGGATPQQKNDLRIGFDQLFGPQKVVAQSKRLRWKTVFSGSRNGAYDKFINAVRRSDEETLHILLVDSEEGLPAETSKPPDEAPEEEDRRKHTDAESRRAHLVNRDNWELGDIPSEHIHLMVRCMEAWIASDTEALAGYYLQGFQANILPARPNLEDEPKDLLYDKLRRATRNSQKKGEYSKTNHAHKLLGLIDQKKVSARCPRFVTFTRWLDEQIRNA